MAEAAKRRDSKRLGLLVALLLATLLGVASVLSWPHLQPVTNNLLNGNQLASNSSSASNVRDGNYCANRRPTTNSEIKTNTNIPANAPPDGPPDPPPVSTLDVTVDFRIKLPELEGAVGWRPISSNSYGQESVIGAEIQTGLPRFPVPPTVRDGYATYSNMLKLRVTGQTLAILVLQVLQPVDASNKEVPGYISFFAAHAILHRDAIDSVRRIVLEHTAPSRNFTLLFDADAAGATFEFLPVNINAPPWVPRIAALRLEPELWPSEAGSAFRFNLERGEYTADNKAFARGIVGFDSTVKVSRLPLGYALPYSIRLWQNASTAPLGERFLSTHAGSLVENSGLNQHAVLPRDGETLAYLRTANDFLPQIKLDGPLASSRSDWSKFSVSCRLCSNDLDQPEGYDIATAYFVTDKAKWLWSVEAWVELQRYAGDKVFYTVEQIGTARALVEGVVAPQPEILISVGPPEKPWTIKATLIDAVGSQLPLPIRFHYAFGNSRKVFEGTSKTSANGVWQLSGIEGPFSQKVRDEGSSVRAEVDGQLLGKLLEDICYRQNGSKVSLDVAVDPDDDRNSPVEYNFVTRRIELNWYFRMLIHERNKDPVTLEAFLASRQLDAAYLEAIKNLLNDDR